MTSIWLFIFEELCTGKCTFKTTRKAKNLFWGASWELLTTRGGFGSVGQRYGSAVRGETPKKNSLEISWLCLCKLNFYIYKKGCLRLHLYCEQECKRKNRSKDTLNFQYFAAKDSNKVRRKAKICKKEERKTQDVKILRRKKGLLQNCKQPKSCDNILIKNREEKGDEF